MMAESSPATMTVEEAAALLRISRSTAYECARSGALPTLRMGKRLLVPVVQLRRLLDGVDGVPR